MKILVLFFLIPVLNAYAIVSNPMGEKLGCRRVNPGGKIVIKDGAITFQSINTNNQVFKVKDFDLRPISGLTDRVAQSWGFPKAYSKILKIQGTAAEQIYFAMLDSFVEDNFISDCRIQTTLFRPQDKSIGRVVLYGAGATCYTISKDRFACQLMIYEDGSTYSTEIAIPRPRMGAGNAGDIRSKY